MNQSSIEFCDYTWNPIVGCNFTCPYCFARRFNKRFNKGNHFAVPKFFPERLENPYRYKKPQRIFVCSMADIFSPGVNVDWINRILTVVRENPQHTFQFLSKRPASYRDFDFPKNTWLGTSVSKPVFAHRIADLTSCGCQYTTFVLVEPLMGNFSKVDFNLVDFVFVGAMTGPGAKRPNDEWITSVNHPNLIYKENIKKYLPSKVMEDVTV